MKHLLRLTRDLLSRLGHRVQVARAFVHRVFSDPLRLVVLGYAFYIVVGWLVLALPFSRTGAAASWLDLLFTSTSAVSTTGLTTVSTVDTYTWIGQAVILLLIQLGGLGYMTVGSFTVLSLTGKLPPLRERVGITTLSLPTGFQIAAFLRVVMLFTLAIEAVGAAALYPVFVAHGAPNPVWQSVFHSVSAFCTAGFGLFNDSFETYRADTWLNIVICALSYLGAIGFIVLSDFWSFVRGRKSWLTLTSKIILISTLVISVAGTVLFFLDEPAIAGLPAGERWLAAMFQVMTATTTVGFNTVPIGALSASSLFLLTAVMIIGASPSGTGGGLKTTSVTALWAVMISVVRRRGQVTFLNREIPDARVRAAAANVLFYFFALFAGIYALALVETAPLADQMFECASALGTVGLSRGITASLTDTGKAIIVVLMFLGRVGPLALGMALVSRAPAEADESPEEDVAI
jgi:trk system potassium uptake protein TrkH